MLNAATYQQGIVNDGFASIVKEFIIIETLAAWGLLTLERYTEGLLNICLLLAQMLEAQNRAKHAENPFAG